MADTILLIKFIVSIIASHLGIVLNCFLLWLIRNKSTKNLAGYQKILYLGAFFDLTFSLSAAAVQPTLVITGDIYLVVIEGWICYIGHPIAFFLTIFHMY